jgi:hypothetical protein
VSLLQTYVSAMTGPSCGFTAFRGMGLCAQASAVCCANTLQPIVLYTQQQGLVPLQQLLQLLQVHLTSVFTSACASKGVALVSTQHYMCSLYIWIVTTLFTSIFDC